MLKNLFGGKKKEFFVELDDSKAPKVEAQAAPVSTPKTESAPVSTEKAEPVAETKKTAATPQKTPVKSKAKAQESQKVAPVVVAPKPVKVEPTEVEFATKYFASNSSRRTPGPSLAKFKEMARQSKSVK